MSGKSGMVICAARGPHTEFEKIPSYVGVRQLDEKLCQQIEPPTIWQPCQVHLGRNLSFEGGPIT